MDGRDQLKYIVLPGAAQRDFSLLGTYCDVYQFWKSTWIEEMTKSGGDPNVVASEDFLRQTEISVVLRDTEIVSLMMSTLYDLALPMARDSKYFSKFPPDVLQRLAEKGERVLTMEFLTVNPQWRGARPGASLGAVTIGLTMRRALRAGASVAIGVARVDNKVNLTALDFGAMPLGRIKKANIECEIVAFYPHLIRDHPDPCVNKLMTQLWNGQTDHRVNKSAAVPRVNAA